MAALIYSGTTVTKYVQYVREPEVTVIATRLYSGAVHVQTVGAPGEYYTVTAYVDAAGRDTLDAAYAAGGVLTAQTKKGTINGAAVSISYEDVIPGWYRAKIKLAGA
jgi:hypothetical protein